MSSAKSFFTLLLAGSVCLFSGCASARVPQNVTVNGVHVGGMEYAAAERAVRSRIAETLLPLTVKTPVKDYTVGYPELSFQDDVRALLRGARAGDELTASVRRTWADMESFAEEVCKENARNGVNAQVAFTEQGFTYTPEVKGTYCDYSLFIQQIAAALNEGKAEVTLPCGEYDPELTEAELRARTAPLSSFATYYDGKNAPRAHNVRLAASRICRTVLQPNEEFSFNQTVGLRTEANGFQIATVIQNGQFAEGIGGGVCQTSTTLFNAALLAGMKITESRAHSLSVSYVKPSLDAMVSEFSDLKFVNPHAFPVYILSRAEGDEIAFEFYGKLDGKTYRTESVTLMKMPPPPAQIVEGEEEKLIRAEKAGLASESYLLTYGEDGTLLSRERIRKDSYAAVQGIYQIIPE